MAVQTFLAVVDIVSLFLSLHTSFNLLKVPKETRIAPWETCWGESQRPHFASCSNVAVLILLRKNAHDQEYKNEISQDVHIYTPIDCNLIILVGLNAS